MLDQLFGNKTIEKILYFLLINGKCYAGRLATHFKSALTPFQHSLNKLEKAGILESHLEKNRRLYVFNVTHPLMNELENLLKKGFILLTPEDKKIYYDSREGELKRTQTDESGSHLIQNVWNRLHAIKKLKFSAISLTQTATGWNGIGKGDVYVRKVSEKSLIFEEKGSWTTLNGGDITFRNVFRWTLDPFLNVISLEHLRQGENHPVFLFDLIQTNKETLASVDSHICKEDIYVGQIRCYPHLIKLNWRVLGPKKNEEIDYLYT